MDKSNRIDTTKYAGAPYIRQLASGEVILSYQGNEYRKDSQWDRSDMIVSIGSSEGRNFGHKSTPFYITDPSKTALWNSLCMENDSTVIALSSTNAYGKTSVWMIRGYVMREIKSPRGTMTVNAEKNESLWKTKPTIFIGGFSTTQGYFRTSWNERLLYVAAEINDEKVYASGDPDKDDAIQFFLDPKKLGPNVPDEHIFSITVTAGGKGSYKQGKKGTWIDWKPIGVELKSNRTTTGYQIEVGIPWTVLNHQAKANQQIGFHAMIFESSNGTRHQYAEPIAGNISDVPKTWCALSLTQ
jgi:hypothetical protein